MVCTARHAFIQRAKDDWPGQQEFLNSGLHDIDLAPPPFAKATARFGQIFNQGIFKV